jgi:hypothetical protein
MSCTCGGGCGSVSLVSNDRSPRTTCSEPDATPSRSGPQMTASPRISGPRILAAVFALTTQLSPAYLPTNKPSQRGRDRVFTEPLPAAGPSDSLGPMSSLWADDLGLSDLAPSTVGRTGLGLITPPGARPFLSPRTGHRCHRPNRHARPAGSPRRCGSSRRRGHTVLVIDDAHELRAGLKLRDQIDSVLTLGHPPRSPLWSLPRTPGISPLAGSIQVRRVHL